MKRIAVHSRSFNDNPSFFSGAIFFPYCWNRRCETHFLPPLHDRPRFQPKIQPPSSNCSGSSKHFTPHPCTPQPSGRTSSLQRGIAAPSTPTSHLTMKTDVRARHLISELLQKKKKQHFFVCVLKRRNHCSGHQREGLSVSESDAGAPARCPYIVAFLKSYLDRFLSGSYPPCPAPAESQPMASPTTGDKLHPSLPFKIKARKLKSFGMRKLSRDYRRKPKIM